MISFKGEFVIFAAKLKDDSLLLKERLLSHNGEFVSIKGWKNNGGNVVFNGWIVFEGSNSPLNVIKLSFNYNISSFNHNESSFNIFRSKWQIVLY